jgi:hypothetical protein
MDNQVPNIGLEGQQTRLQGGLVSLTVGAVAGLTLILSGFSRRWRLLLFLPFWQGALGVFQARDKT